MNTRVDLIIRECLKSGYKIPKDLNDVISNSSILIETIEHISNQDYGEKDENQTIK